MNPAFTISFFFFGPLIPLIKKNRAVLLVNQVTHKEHLLQSKVSEYVCKLYNLSSWDQTTDSNKEFPGRKGWKMEGLLVLGAGSPDIACKHSSQERGVVVPQGVEGLESWFENNSQKWRVLHRFQVADNGGIWEKYAHKTEKKLQPNISKLGKRN